MPPVVAPTIADYIRRGDPVLELFFAHVRLPGLDGKA
jgi:hypothetical protein